MSAMAASSGAGIEQEIGCNVAKASAQDREFTPVDAIIIAAQVELTMPLSKTMSEQVTGPIGLLGNERVLL
jgi:hypothetical protein